MLWIDESIFKAFLGSLIVKQAVESAAMLQYYVFYRILDLTILILENSFKNNKTIFLNGSTHLKHGVTLLSCNLPNLCCINNKYIYFCGCSFKSNKSNDKSNYVKVHMWKKVCHIADVSQYLLIETLPKKFKKQGGGLLSDCRSAEVLFVAMHCVLL